MQTYKWIPPTKREKCTLRYLVKNESQISYINDLWGKGGHGLLN